MKQEFDSNTPNINSRQDLNIAIKSALYKKKESDFIMDKVTSKRDYIDKISDSDLFRQNTIDDSLYDVSFEYINNLSKLGHDKLASNIDQKSLTRLYKNCCNEKTRERYCQFYTNNFISTVITEIAKQFNPDTILEPAVGTGLITESILSEINFDTVKINDTDWLSLQIASMMGEKVEYNKSEFLTEYNPDQNYDLIVSNPPYQRYNEMDENTKEAIKNWNEHSDFEISTNVPLYIPFMLKSMENLNENGKGVFLTPVEYTYTEYGQDIIEIFEKRYNVEDLIYFDLEESVFDDASSSACLTVISKKGDQKTRFSHVTKQTSDPEVLFSRIKESNTADNLRVMKKSNESKNWFEHFNREKVDHDLDQKLNDIGYVKRGINTGCNEFFCITENTRKKYNIDPQYLEKIVKSPKLIDGRKIDLLDWKKLKNDNKPCWVVHTSKKKSSLGDGIKDYIKYGEINDYNDNYTLSNRSIWYRVTPRDAPDILFKYMSGSSGGRFVYNKAGLKNLNNIHGIYLPKHSQKQIKAITTYLNCAYNSKQEISKYGRKYGRDLVKLEPSELGDLPVINPTRMSESDTNSLAKYFKKVTSSENLDFVDISDKVIEIIN